MSNINLNDFWNKVREDIEATLPKEILESTIIRLLPLQLDEISKTLTLTTMQTYIKDFIENEPMIKNAFQNSVNNVWQRLNQKQFSTYNYYYNTGRQRAGDPSRRGENNRCPTECNDATGTNGFYQSTGKL